MKKVSIILLVVFLALFFVMCIPEVEAPTFDPAGSTVAQGTQITISTTTEGATIYYTIGDGTQADPTSTSTEYSENNKPTISTNNTIIKAIAIKDNGQSTVATASYTIDNTVATIIFNVQKDWGDGTGYQLLLDADHTAYGDSIPGTSWQLQSGNIYTDAEYKIPSNADYDVNTENIILAPNKVTLVIPSGTYDWVIVNPFPPAGKFYIARYGKGNDWVAEGGKLYMFSVIDEADGDLVILTEGNIVPELKVKYKNQVINNNNATPQSIGEVNNTIPFKFTLENYSFENLEITNITFTDGTSGTLTMTPITTPIMLLPSQSVDIEFTTTGNISNSGIIHIESNDAVSPFEFRFSCALVAPLTIPFTEDFNSLTLPALPAFWVTYDIVGTVPTWITSYNTLFDYCLYYPYGYGTQGNKQRVIMREFDMSSLTQDPTLLFNLKQPNWEGRCENVRVFLKVGNGNWTELASYTTSIENFENKSVTLTGAAGQSLVFVAFEGEYHNAYGAFIDDVIITNNPEPEMDLVVGVNSISDGGTFTASAESTSGATTDITIIIKNNGFSPLNLTNSPNNVVMEAGGDSRITIYSQPLSSTINYNNSTPFVIRFTGDDTITTASANFTIANNDTDENPYNFTLTINPVAVTTVTIGTGTELYSHIPIEPFYGYTYSQVIYLQSEINQTGNIRKIRYHFAANEPCSPWTDDIVVYMGHTTKTAFDNMTDWVTGLTEVYNGQLSTQGVAGWIEITLDTPFAYNNTQNLIIAVDENTTGFHGNEDFYASTVSGNRSIVFYDDSINPNPTNPPAANLIQTLIANIHLLFY